MSNTLLVIPNDIKNNKIIEKQIEFIDELAGKNKKLFYFDNSNINELKNLLIDQSYQNIIVSFISLDNNCNQIQIIKSLSPDSRLILFYPDISFIKKCLSMQTSNGSNDLVKWYKTGKELQCNICRQSDLIITDSEDSKRILEKEISGTNICCESEVKNLNTSKANRKNKEISIIMLTFNQYKLTKQCVESLEKYTTLDYELIFVDNGSTDETKKYLTKLKETKKNIKLIFNEKNVGFSKANNQGIRIAFGEYILLLNNDIIFTNHWLDKLLACAESDPSIGVVGPCTNHAVGQQLVNFDIKMEESQIQKFAWMQAIKNAGNWFEVHRVIGFCMLIKKQVIDTIGMLDERFGPGGFEDYDFCLRVKQAGYKIMIANDVFIYHIGGQGYSKNNLDYDKLRCQNVQIFIDKWSKKALEILETMPDTP